MAALLFVLAAAGCAHVAKLPFIEPVSPMLPDTARGATPTPPHPEPPYVSLFGDTLIGFKAGSGDSTKRYLGRLRTGFTADTLNLFILGDNRPSYRLTPLRDHMVAMKQMLSPNPVRWLKGLVHIPLFLFRATFPDLKLIRDIPAVITHRPTWGREAPIVKAMITKLDSLQAQGKTVAAIINSGDLVKDGRYAEHWLRFLRITRPLSKRVPYFPVAGNHERTDDSTGLWNWRAATGMPIESDRLWYCFDSADGWVRFIALDSNPMTDPKGYWSKEVETEYSNEQIDWMVARLKEHPGPAIVFLHHPPFSAGFHRVEWQSDPLLVERRARIVGALKEAGLAVLVASHEHAYERALMTCGDAVLIVLVAGGGGSPLHQIPVGETAAQLFAAYDVEGCRFKPEHVFTSMIFQFVHMRLWFGGGEFFTYEVDPTGNTNLVDHVHIDLKRFGVPKIDQDKIPILQEKGPAQPPPPEEAKGKRQIAADTTAIGKGAKPKPAEPAAPSPSRQRRR